MTSGSAALQVPPGGLSADPRSHRGPPIAHAYVSARSSADPHPGRPPPRPPPPPPPPPSLPRASSRGGRPLRLAMCRGGAARPSGELFSALRADPANQACCDGGAGEAEWASVSHGIYLSIAAAGVHRSMGVRTSFVQSTAMDAWKPLHLRMMELGGNRRFSDFLRQHGIPDGTPLREKYATRAAAWYRRALRAEAEGSDAPEPLAENTGHLPEESCASSAVLDRVFAEAKASPAHAEQQVAPGARQPRRGRQQRGQVGLQRPDLRHPPGQLRRGARRGRHAAQPAGQRCPRAPARRLRRPAGQGLGQGHEDVGLCPWLLIAAGRARSRPPAASDPTHRPKLPSRSRQAGPAATLELLSRARCRLSSV